MDQFCVYNKVYFQSNVSDILSQTKNDQIPNVDFMEKIHILI
jgi:hypothetical protein